MSVNDKGIVDTLKECPENGFRMLLMKYQEQMGIRFPLLGLVRDLHPLE